MVKDGEIFLLEMGKPIKTVNIAKRLDQTFQGSSQRLIFQLFLQDWVPGD